MTRRGKYWQSDPERKRKAEEKRERRRLRNLNLMINDRIRVTNRRVRYLADAIAKTGVSANEAAEAFALFDPIELDHMGDLIAD